MDATQHGDWGGVGHVNVPCNLHALWMLRNTGIGVGWGMLTFHVTCMRCGCYATRGFWCGGSRDLTSHRDNSWLNAYVLAVMFRWNARPHLLKAAGSLAKNASR